MERISDPGQDSGLTQNIFENFLEGSYIRPTDLPASGDISGTYNSGLTINGDSITLGTDTLGDYVKNIVAGDGLSADANGEGSVAVLSIAAGDGIAVGSDGLSANLSSNGGLTFVNSGLSLLATCSANQILKWNSGLSAWECGNDNSGSGALTAQETDGSPSVASVSILEFGPASSSSGEFILTDQGGGRVRVRTGTLIPLTDALATISGAWTFNAEITTAGGLACSDCIELGSETTGSYIAGLSAGSGISILGSGGENATATVGLDSSLAIFKTIDASLGTDPVADSLTDTLSLNSGNGVNVTGDATTDSVSFSININSNGGITTVSSGLSLLNTCGDNQYLKWTSSSSSWGCASLASAPNLFQTISGDSGSAVADSAADTITVVGGNGIATTASEASDTLTVDVDLASGGGLAFSGGGLSLLACSDGQILKHVSGVWACAADDTGQSVNTAYKEQLSGTDNVTVGSSPTPLLTNGSGTAQSLPITITSGHKISFIATIEVSSSLATGPLTYMVVRDDNSDNDCATGGGDGTQVGAQVTSFIASVAQSFTNAFSFADSSPSGTTNRYQLCASTSIALGTATITDRSLRLEEAIF